MSRPVTREAYWADERSGRGQECLVNREQFDAGLRAALCKAGLAFVDASVREVQLVNGVWRVATTEGPVAARTVLDARGRYARRSDHTGPPLVAWNVHRRSDMRAPAASAVAALEDGWCWVARSADGVLSLQFVGCATNRTAGAQLARRIEAAARILPGFRVELNRLSVVEASGARAAVARYSQPSRQPGFLRIGDAAVAMDPLSGNGILEALRSARVAVAAIHSYLHGAEWSVVGRFVDERARELWRRSVSAAAGFYRLQANVSPDGFWTWAAGHYERAAEAAIVHHEGSARFEMRPVLDGENICLRRVWVCAEWPRGVWQVDGQVLEQIPVERVPSILRRAAGGSHHEV
jgi:flavin-dependent dehydrogenase